MGPTLPLQLGLPDVPYFKGCPVFGGTSPVWCHASHMKARQDATCPVFRALHKMRNIYTEYTVFSIIIIAYKLNMGQVTLVSSQTLSDMQSPSKFKEKCISTAVTLNCFATNNFNNCFQMTGIFEWLGFGSSNIFMSRFSVREIWHPYLQQRYTEALGT